MPRTANLNRGKRQMWSNQPGWLNSPWIYEPGLIQPPLPDLLNGDRSDRH